MVVSPDWDDDLLGPDEDTGDVPPLDPEFHKELRRVSGDDAEEAEAVDAEQPDPEASDVEDPDPEASDVEDPDPEATQEWDAAGATPGSEPGAEASEPTETGDQEPETETDETDAQEPEATDGEKPEATDGEKPEATDGEKPEAQEGEPDKPRKTVVIGAAKTAADGGTPPPKTPPVVAAPEGEIKRPPSLWLRFLGASLLIVVSFAAATSVSLLLFLSDIAAGLGDQAQLKGVVNQLANVRGGAPETILIVGSDRRAADPKHANGRSDTAILLRLDPHRKAMALFSIPRDLKVNIPGYGVDKFNAAYSLGGPKLTLKVVKQLTGLQVNHLVNVDFQGFVEAINAIGCVYADVDRNYFHSNKGLPASQQYDEIHIQAGYQRLCGDNALHFVRYRHTDTDIVRGARQQDFLREARQEISPVKLFEDRTTLLKIFTKYTSSDINDPETMLQVLKTFLASRNEPIHEVHFVGRLGASYVTSSQGQLQTAVHQFLGIRATAGPRGTLKRSDVYASVPAAEAKSARKHSPGLPPKSRKKKHKPKVSSKGLEDSTHIAKRLARLAQPDVGFPIYYPTRLVPGSIFDQRPRVYNIIGPDRNSSYQAIKWVFKTPILGEYYGLMGTTWKNPPILNDPTSSKHFQGREFKLYYDGDRLRLIAWQTDRASYWVSNSVLQTLSQKQMLGIAARTAHTTPHHRKHRR